MYKQKHFKRAFLKRYYASTKQVLVKKRERGQVECCKNNRYQFWSLGICRFGPRGSCFWSCVSLRGWLSWYMVRDTRLLLFQSLLGILSSRAQILLFNLFFFYFISFFYPIFILSHYRYHQTNFKQFFALSFSIFWFLIDYD